LGNTCFTKIKARTSLLHRNHGNQVSLKNAENSPNNIVCTWYENTELISVEGKRERQAKDG
jgi:hypothetical protein